MKRRTFLRLAAGSAVAAGGAGIYSFGVEPHWVEFVRRPMPISGLPPELAGKTLVHLSDTHVGRYVSDDYLMATFKRVASLTPDIVVLTGDVTSYHDEITPHVRRVLAPFPRGRLATLAILGNHDYHGDDGWTNQQAAATVTAAVTDCGIRVLRNETVDVAGLQFVGLDDLWAGQFKPERPLSQLDPTRAAIALSHNPDTADRPVWNGFHGWILSGHTHGGQCKPPFLPPPMLPVSNRRYTRGEFDLAGGRKLYINRGLGHLLRVRFNVRPEVTVFQLSAAPLPAQPTA